MRSIICVFNRNAKRFSRLHLEEDWSKLVTSLVLSKSSNNYLLNLFRRVSQVSQLVKSLPAMQEKCVRSLDWDPLKKVSNIPVWRILWTEEAGGLPSMGSKESELTEQLALSLFSNLLKLTFNVCLANGMVCCLSNWILGSPICTVPLENQSPSPFHFSLYLIPHVLIESHLLNKDFYFLIPQWSTSARIYSHHAFGVVL